MELMSPAGSFDSLTAAIQAGADAVYFGVEQLNMRARSANNFSLNDMFAVAEQCRQNNVKAYLTLNTIIYDHDVSLMERVIATAKAARVSAIIASDHAVLQCARDAGVPVHISTQLNVCNIESVKFYSRWADVMVLARELSLTQTAAIVRDIKRRKIVGPSGDLVKIEIFGHGALCMAVSGMCYMSLHSDFASANRGACIQNCRHSYIVTDSEDGTQYEIDNGYIMSAKDLCTIDFLDKIAEAGVEVLKIEGRGRAPEYVHTTTRCYREAISALNTNTYDGERVAQWKTELSKVYNRGFWDGYYLGKKIGEWSDGYGSRASERKIFLGKSVKYYDGIQVGEFHIEAHSLQQDDAILITGPRTGVIRTTASEIRVDDHPVTEVSRGTRFSIPLPSPVRPNDKLYKVVANA